MAPRASCSTSRPSSRSCEPVDARAARDARTLAPTEPGSAPARRPSSVGPRWDHAACARRHNEHVFLSRSRRRSLARPGARATPTSWGSKGYTARRCARSCRAGAPTRPRWRACDAALRSPTGMHASSGIHGVAQPAGPAGGDHGHQGRDEMNQTGDEVLGQGLIDVSRPRAFEPVPDVPARRRWAAEARGGEPVGFGPRRCPETSPGLPW
jgi:hypothetical protein